MEVFVHLPLKRRYKWEDSLYIQVNTLGTNRAKTIILSDGGYFEGTYGGKEQSDRVIDEYDEE